VTVVVGSVGTDHHPFPRLLNWVAEAQRELGFQATIQRGATPPHPSLDTVEFVAALDLEAMMTQADVVVCHGGPGTISLAMRCGHRPIVIARDPAFGEHVDDHQQRYTRRLASEGSIDLPATQQALRELIADAPARADRTVIPYQTSVESADRFSDLVTQLVTGALPKRKLRQRILIRRTL
jgi:UDP-N-acetylglucosamine transferase subunit ALG13